MPDTVLRPGGVVAQEPQETGGMDRQSKGTRGPLKGEALVQAALANEELVAATEESYRRAERGEPALFFRGEDFLRRQTS